MAAAFADDAQQCLAEMEASLLAIESGQSASEALRTFLRQLHTLKGASGTVGLHKLATFIHSLESNVEETTKNGIDVDQLLKCVDAVRFRLSTFGISEGDSPLPTMDFKADVTPVPPSTMSRTQPTPVAVGNAGCGNAGCSNPWIAIKLVTFHGGQ
jgi:chemosensory pili system protein ChpA (sensor histidine kinase/response regulator)